MCVLCCGCVFVYVCLYCVCVCVCMCARVCVCYEYGGVCVYVCMSMCVCVSTCVKVCVSKCKRGQEIRSQTQPTRYIHTHLMLNATVLPLCILPDRHQIHIVIACVVALH